jgi:hypothetical protein
MVDCLSSQAALAEFAEDIDSSDWRRSLSDASNIDKKTPASAM